MDPCPGWHAGCCEVGSWPSTLTVWEGEPSGPLQWRKEDSPCNGAAIAPGRQLQVPSSQTKHTHKEMATHSSILARIIPWTEEPTWRAGYSPWGCKETDTTEQLTLLLLSASQGFEDSSNAPAWERGAGGLAAQQPAAGPEWLVPAHKCLHNLFGKRYPGEHMSAKKIRNSSYSNRKAQVTLLFEGSTSGNWKFNPFY